MAATLKEVDVEAIAKVAHEVVRTYGSFFDEIPGRPWAKTPEALKESVREAVRFAIDYPRCTASQLHKAWMRQIKAAGWVDGPYLRVREKLHPNVRRWHELAIESQRQFVLLRAMASDD